MSPEALRFNRFSEQSDVWAFGVTALELLSRGELPYFDITDDDRVTDFVVRARGKPRRPPECMYSAYTRLWQCIDACWGHDAAVRPRFAQLSVTLGQMPIPDPDSTATMPPYVKHEGCLKGHCVVGFHCTLSLLA